VSFLGHLRVTRELLSRDDTMMGVIGFDEAMRKAAHPAHARRASRPKVVETESNTGRLPHFLGAAKQVDEKASPTVGLEGDARLAIATPWPWRHYQDRRARLARGRMLASADQVVSAARSARKKQGQRCRTSLLGRSTRMSPASARAATVQMCQRSCHQSIPNSRGAFRYSS